MCSSHLRQARGVLKSSQLNFLVDLKFKHNNVIDSKKSLNMSQTTKDLTTKISESGEKSVSLSNETKALTSEIKRSTEATCEAVDKTADLATKADRDGRTVMVFTVVTIIFVRLLSTRWIAEEKLIQERQLPLSFMATMFQLPIDQYKRTDDKLDLGYVSAIMCKTHPLKWCKDRWTSPLITISPYISTYFNGAHLGCIQSRQSGGSL